MFRLTEIEVKLGKINTRIEKHGVDNKPAMDLPFELVTGTAVLDMFASSLRAALYRDLRSGEQAPLLEGQADGSHLLLPRLKPLVWDEDFPGYEVALETALGLEEPLVFADANLTGFTFKAMDGGSVQVTWKVQCHPTQEQAGELYMSQGNTVSLTCTPPNRKPGDEEEGETILVADPNQQDIDLLEINGADGAANDHLQQAADALGAAA